MNRGSSFGGLGCRTCEHEGPRALKAYQAHARAVILAAGHSKVALEGTSMAAQRTEDTGVIKR